MVLCPSPRPCLLRRNAHSQRKSVAEETLLSFFNVCVDTYCFSIYSLIYLFTYFGRWYLMHSLYFSFFFLPPTVIVLITHAVEICSNNKVGIVVDLMSNPCFLTQNFHFPQFHYCWMWLTFGLGSLSLFDLEQKRSCCSNSRLLCKYNMFVFS